MSVLVAIGVNNKGYGKILDVVEGANEDKSVYPDFLQHVKKLDLKGLRRLKRLKRVLSRP